VRTALDKKAEDVVVLDLRKAGGFTGLLRDLHRRQLASDHGHRRQRAATR
jgi:L-alanine-DL-glutamate epimerase-like enolase superfamily enzyme